MLTRSPLFWGVTRRVLGPIRPVKMGPIRYPETSVNNHHTTPCNNPEERRSQSSCWLDPVQHWQHWCCTCIKWGYTGIPHVSWVLECLQVWGYNYLLVIPRILPTALQSVSSLYDAVYPEHHISIIATGNLHDAMSDLSFLTSVQVQRVRGRAHAHSTVAHRQRIELYVCTNGYICVTSVVIATCSTFVTVRYAVTVC